MRWQGREKSENVEDRRRRVSPGMAMGGGLGAIVMLILAVLFGADPKKLQQMLGENPQPAAAQQERELTAAEKERGDFVAVVLKDTETVWEDLFRGERETYQKPKLVLFSGKVESRCGFASAAVGPFYCPADRNVYIDLSFFDDLKQRHAAPGDFAQAYVIAHEIGHHVQNLRGTSDWVQGQRERVNEVEANRLSVRLELQADYLAGVWAHHGQKRFAFLEPGDIEEALRAATAIGDDRLQEQARGYVQPDSFTHGSSEQRVRWFREGLKSGDLAGADMLFGLEYDQL